MTVEQLIQLPTADGLRVALWKLLADRTVAATTEQRHVLLTHGTFSDRRVCASFARYLASHGHTCWILEWRGHGASQRDDRPFDLETIALFDLKATLEYLLEQERVPRLECATHSGGGIALTMCLARHTGLRPHIGNVVLFACQACHAGFSPWRRLALRAAKQASGLLGRIPGRRLRIGIQDESYFTMEPWFDWNIGGRFHGRDGFDYLEHMAGLALPVLAIVGAADRFIAPLPACRRYLAAFDHAGSRELLCAATNGFSRDFGHADVLHSSTASNEIWPRARHWLECGQLPGSA
jgi:pimeloyl-ACP methyl ester carboxylesterase